MNANVKHLDHLNLSVRSFDESAGWYRRVFGFEVVEKGEIEGRPWGVLKAGDAMLCIYEHPDRVHLDGAGLRERKLHGFDHFGLRITDRESWLATLEREGLELLYGSPIRWPHSTSWYVADPTGHEIEVVSWNDDRVAFSLSESGA